MPNGKKPHPFLLKTPSNLPLAGGDILKGEKVMDRKFTIAEKEFIFNLTVETDQLCAPIESEMYKALPSAFTVVAESLTKLAQVKKPETEEEWTAAKKLIADGTISIGYSMVQITQWLREKKYGSRLMAILLKPIDKDFDESDITEREIFMRKHGTTKTMREVINLFFLKSGD
jgi:hypothetical protein